MKKIRKSKKSKTKKIENNNNNEERQYYGARFVNMSNIDYKRKILLDK
jgi:hypothetical protein